MRCNLYGNRYCEDFPINVLNAEEILFNGATTQPYQMNPCLHAQCSGICVQSSNGYACLCDDKLVEHTYTCTANHLIQGNLDNKIKRLTTMISDGIVPEVHCHTTKVLSASIILLLIVAFGFGYYKCSARERNMSPVMTRNLQFQNPLSALLRDDELQHQPPQPPADEAVPPRPPPPTPASINQNRQQSGATAANTFQTRRSRNRTDKDISTTTVFDFDMDYLPLSGEDSRPTYLGETTPPFESSARLQLKPPTNKVLMSTS